jgi:hypothetical protein
MLLIIALLIGVLLLIWLFNGVLIALGWAFKAVYYLCVALWVTTLALARGGRWSYRRVAQWRGDRAAAALLRL